MVKKEIQVNKEQFFEGLKVVELASVLAGPAVGMFFAELGAEVVKIENARTGGDVTRRWRLPSESAEASYSAYYCSVNYKKRVLMLDLSSPEGQEETRQLIADADIVVSNFKRASATKLGMDYDSLRSINPKLIYAQLDAFGADEPLPAFDVVLQAEAGFLHMNGEPDRDPVKMPVALIDILAAHQLKEALLLALLHRYRTGEGSFVSTSLLDAAIASLANQATNWLMEGHIPQRMGTQHPNIAPYGDIFYARDEKPMIIAAGTEAQFVNLCNALGLTALPQDPRFSDNKSRVENRVILCQLLLPAFRQEDRSVWLERLGKAGVPVGSIRNMEEVFQRKRAQELVLEETSSDGTTTKRVMTAAFEWVPAAGIYT